MYLTSNNPECAIITLFVHNVCNYNCSYCSDYHRIGDYRWPSDWTPYLNFIKDLKSRHKFLYVEVLGGEPTLWPKFQDFVLEISGPNVFVEFSTNASRTIRYWEQFANANIMACLSWHSEEADDEHFIKVAEILQEKVCVHIPLMVTPENFERAKAIFDRLKHLNTDLVPKLTRKNISNPEHFDFTPEQLEWISNNKVLKMVTPKMDWMFPKDIYIDDRKIKWPKMQRKNLHNFNGWTCTAGIKRFFVDKNGDIERCTKRVGEKLGNIMTGYALIDEPIVCHKDRCPCKMDVMVDKWI